jgi:hypothetical protein
VATKEPEHGPAVIEQIALVEKDIGAMLKVGKRLFGEGDAPIFPLDFLAYGAIKRNLSTAKALTLMVATWNMVCARSLLRVHIDTSLRFSAAWLVDKPHDFASQVMKGMRIDKLRDSKGNRLTDAHLVATRATDHPWLPAVYETLSSYVHFSGSHVYDSLAEFESDKGVFSVEIASTDFKFPEFSWIEVLECSREATAMLAYYLRGYIKTKGLSSQELEALRAKAD